MRDDSKEFVFRLRFIFAGLAVLAGTACETGNLERNAMVGRENRNSWAEREFSVTVTVPDPAWQVGIEEIYVVGEELWVLSHIRRDPETMAAQVISRASDSVETAAPDYPERHYLFGRKWAWENEDAPENYSFPEDRADLEEALTAGERIFVRE